MWANSKAYNFIENAHQIWLLTIVDLIIGKENIQLTNKKLYCKKFKSTYKNLKVLVTGSTGFKGSWLSFWLNKLNAKVIGVGLKPEKDNILFSSLKLNKKINQHFIDICDYNKLSSIIQKARPDIIFHSSSTINCIR